MSHAKDTQSPEIGALRSSQRPGAPTGMSPCHPWPCAPTLLALALLLTGIPVAQPWRVHSIVGGWVLLSPVLPPNMTVKETEWSFSSGAGTTIQVAEWGPHGLERPNPEDQFRDRLEMVNETALRIRALERGDTGVYGARIKLHPTLVEDQSFHLYVYEPVPEPEIQHQQPSLSTQWCNVTLRCSVPPGKGAEAAWHLGGSPWAQLCEDGLSLCLAVPTSTLNSSLTCVARNPIQERSVSIRLDTLCQQQQQAVAGSPQWVIGLPVALVVLVGIGVCVWWWKEKRNPGEQGSPRDSQPLNSQGPSPQADEQQAHSTTIYSQMQAGTGSDAEMVT